MTWELHGSYKESPRSLPLPSANQSLYHSVKGEQLCGSLGGEQQQLLALISSAGLVHTQPWQAQP